MPAPVVRFLFLAAVPLSLAAEACVHPAAAPSSHVSIPDQPPQVVTVEAITRPPPNDTVVTLDKPRDDATLPVSWSSVHGDDIPVAGALDLAAWHASVLVRETFPRPGTLDAGALQRITAALDETTRGYARAFHAPDASAIDKAQALASAATAVLAGARYLDAHGFHDTAGAVRTDAKVALSFEDVELGPGRHWRSEGLALARHCITLATQSGLGAITETCVHLVQDHPVVTSASSVDGCACDPGDPLCSSSMSGWCRPSSP